MSASERELWVLNFFRNSELYGALLMGRLARALGDTTLLVNATRHCATEARHAAMLSEAISRIGGRLDPRIETIQERYAAKGGVTASVIDLLILSEVLERRVLSTYRAYLTRREVHPVAREALTAIVGEMEQEGPDEHAGWIEAALHQQPHDAVEQAETRWRAIDAQVAREIAESVEARFPEQEQV